MSQTKTRIYDFANSVDKTYDDTKIVVDATGAHLKLTNNSGNIFTENFTNDTGFVYDNTKVEFAGGVARQKDQRLVNTTCAATYTNGINLNWGNGVLTGTATNGCAVSGGKLLCDGTIVAKFVSYTATDNVSTLVQTGCVRFKLIPNFTTSPGQDIGYFSMAIAANDARNLVQLDQANGNPVTYLTITSSTGALILSQGYSLNLISGVEIEIEIDFDLTIGATRLFKNGTQIGTTNTAIGMRSSNIALFRVGSSYDGRRSNFYIDDFMVFSAVQHVANYTAGYVIPETIYIESSVICPEMQYTGAGALVSFDTFSTTDSGTPKYSLQVGRSGNYLYWNGGAWVTSNGTYAQATDETTFNTNLGSLDILGHVYGQFKVHFQGANIQSSVDSVSASLTAQIYPTTNPTILLTDTAGMLEELLSFVESSTVSPGSALKYVLKKDDYWYFWNGLQWALSDGTYAQSSLATEINANAATFVSDAVSEIFQIKVFLHSDAGLTTPVLRYLTVSYDFWGGLRNALNTCIVYGYVVNENGNPVSGVNIFVDPHPREIMNGNSLMMLTRKTTTTDATGYWDIELFDTSNIDLRYLFTFVHGDNIRSFLRRVPNTESKSFSELVEG